MLLPAAVAKKIASAKVSTGGNRLKDGEYLLCVKNVICEQKFSGLMFIPEFEVCMAEKSHATVDPSPVGSEVSMAWALDATGKAGEAAFGNVKQFVCGLYGLELSTPDEKFLEILGKMTAENTRGLLVECKTVRKMIQSGKNAGTEGTFYKFAHVSAENGNGKEDVAERRAALEAGKKVSR